MEKVTTNGATIREVTGWDEIDFVGDDDSLVVHFGGNFSQYATWLDERGSAQTLGTLTTDQMVFLGSRQRDAVEGPGTRAVTVCVDGSHLVRYRDGVVLRRATPDEAERSAREAEEDGGRGLFCVELPEERA
jgi:hypothetical protein